MALISCARKLALASAVSAAGVVVMNGVAGAEETTGGATSAEAVGRPVLVEVGEVPTDVTVEARPGGAAGPSGSSNRGQAAAGRQPAAIPASLARSDPPARPATSDVRAGQAGTSITSPGPLTRVHTTPDLNCAVNHADDEEPEFYRDTACGTFMAVGGELFGPADVPAGRGASPRTAYTPVRQSPVTGSGSFGDPYKLVTVVNAGTTGLSINQADSYVVGQESYRTDVTVANAGTSARTAQLYRAGDCFLQDSDEGFGRVDTATGAVACVAGVRQGAGWVPGSRIEQWFPLSPGSHFYEDFYEDVWRRIGSQLPFPDLCAACDEFEDNAAGLSWEVTIPAGGSVVRSHLTTFSPVGLVPLSLTHTVSVPTAVAGSVVRFTLVVRNPNELTVNLNSIVDTLPEGFSYVPGSTSRVLTFDPTIVGRVLTWGGPIEVSPFGAVALDFAAIVSQTAGTYFNDAAADAGTFVVVPPAERLAITVVAGEEVAPEPRPPTVAGVSLISEVDPRGLLPGASSTRRAAATRPRPDLGGTGASGQLPRTGFDPQGLAVLAGLLVLGGGALALAGRRGAGFSASGPCARRSSP